MEKNRETSTDEYDPIKFRPHGRVNFKRDEQILVCDAIGPFNMELIDAIAHVEISLLRELINDGRWAGVVIINESALASQETLHSFGEYIRYFVDNNLGPCATALVIDDNKVIGAKLMAPLIQQKYIDAGIKIEVFGNFNDAKTWALTQL